MKPNHPHQLSLPEASGLRSRLAALWIFSASLGFAAPGTLDVGKPPALDKAVPPTFQLAQPPGTQADKPSQSLAIRRLEGRELPKSGEIQPILVTAGIKGVIANEPLVVGDVILAVNGKALGADPTRQFRTAFKEANDGPGFFWVARSREGKVEQCLVDLGIKPLDLTKGAPHNPNQMDWNLGVTGARGWMWSIPHRTTEGTTQIYITRIEEGTPSDGVLKVGDIILGAFGKPFTNDARKEFGRALTLAESPDKKGKLSLGIWRQGTKRTVEVKIPEMGSYSESAPAQCAKTDRIIEEACAHFRKAGLGKEFDRYGNALGLLATGREEFLPILREFAQKLAADSVGYESKIGVSTWSTGYGNLFLTEYMLLTDDKSVLPAIQQYSMALCRGQSLVGTWGHRGCIPYFFVDGPRYGITPGYGELNCCGEVALISLVLARKCGVNGPEIDTAIKRGADFLRYYQDKGSIPYGDHPPGIGDHDDNGKNSMAAVLFDLLGEEKPATYNTMMTVASHDDREYGHTGNYFSFLWGPLGAARGGEKATAAFMERLEWFFDMERRPTGKFVYQGKPGMGKEKGGEHQYVDWDCTGARLLAYCLPLKKLHITGKGGGAARQLPDAELADALKAGELPETAYAKLSAKELLEKLGNWSPVVRYRAAKALGGKEDNVVAELLAMLDSPERFARYGACAGLRYAGRASAEAAYAVMTKALPSDDLTLRYNGVKAFECARDGSGLTLVAPLALPDLLRLATVQHPEDVVSRIQYELSHVLFGRSNESNPLLNAKTISMVDHAILLDAIRALLQSPNGATRSLTTGFYSTLPEKELPALWSDIQQAVRDLAPTGVMFSAGARLDGLSLMAKYRSKEGLAMAVDYLQNQKGHGSGPHTDGILKIIVGQYGGHAKAYIPQMEKIAAFLEKGMLEMQSSPNPEVARKIREAIKVLEKTPPPTDELRALADLPAAGSQAEK